MAALYNEIEPFAADWLEALVADRKIVGGRVDRRSIRDLLARDVAPMAQVHLFGGIGGWSYALRLAGWPDDCEVWTGSCPCFAAGSLVLTRGKGLCPIEEVEVGDFVMTHRRRWRSVTATMRSEKSTILVKGQGHWGIETTSEHPFLTDDGKWTKAKDLKGQRWACADSAPPASIPSLPSKTWRGRSQVPDLECVATWKFIGFWVGNGWTRQDRQVVICDDVGSGDRLRRLAKGAGLTGCLSIERTSARFRIGSKRFAVWLREHFGSSAPTKTVPSWLLGASVAILDAFIEGLLLADGHAARQKKGGGRIRCLTTTSRALAVGVRMIFNRLGRSASIGWVDRRRRCVIEGREVSERPSYRVTSYERARSFRLGDDFGWGKVRTVVPTGRRETVYNIAVAQDESYVVDGLVVHNCTPFSTAGRRRGFDDDRHLWPEFFRLIAERNPSVVFGEQVASPDGRAWLDLVFADLEGAGYACGATNLCAAGIGAPHLRQRLYFVAIANGKRLEGVRAHLRRRRSRRDLPEARGGGEAGELADADECRGGQGGSVGRGRGGGGGSDEGAGPRCGGAYGELADAERGGCGALGPGEAGGGGRPIELDRRVEDGELADPGLAGGGRDAGGVPEEEGGVLLTDRRILDELVAAGFAGELGDAGRPGPPLGPWRTDGRGAVWLSRPTPAEAGAVRGPWATARWFACRDPKHGVVLRPAQPGLQPLVDGFPGGRVGSIRGAGNAIVPQVAATFIEAVIDYLVEGS